MRQLRTRGPPCFCLFAAVAADVPVLRVLLLLSLLVRLSLVLAAGDAHPPVVVVAMVAVVAVVVELRTMQTALATENLGVIGIRWRQLSVVSQPVHCCQLPCDGCKRCSDGVSNDTHMCRRSSLWHTISAPIRIHRALAVAVTAAASVAVAVLLFSHFYAQL